MELQNERTGTRDLQIKHFKNEEHFNKCKKVEIERLKKVIARLKNKVEVMKGKLKETQNDNWEK